MRKSGRKLILVTGRDLLDLQRVFPQLELFDLVVAENGALLFDPAKKEETPLAEAPSPAFVERLRQLGVLPLAVGRTIVATWEPNEKLVLECIRELALELHIVFNKGAVMVLPGNAGQGVGDGHCTTAGAQECLIVLRIANADDVMQRQAQRLEGTLETPRLVDVKAKADVEVADHGAGVIELARMLTESDLRGAGLKIPRVQPELGTRADKTPICLSPVETTLITGGSGSGKSTIVTALLEQLRDLAFLFCVVDPEGDYSELADAVVVGDAKQEPRLGEVMRLLAKPEVSVVVNLLAVDPPERPRFLAEVSARDRQASLGDRGDRAAALDRA